MPVEFAIVTQGTRAAYFRLTRIAERVGDPRPALEEIYLTILDIIDETFDREGARSGFPRWEELTPARKKYKTRKGLIPEILRARHSGSDILKTTMSGGRNTNLTTRLESKTTKIVFTPRLIKHRVHQTGARIPGKAGARTVGAVSGKAIPSGGGQLPARPFVRFSQADQAAFARELLRYYTSRGVGE